MTESESAYKIIKRYPRSKPGTSIYHETHDNEVKEDNILNLNSTKNLGVGALLDSKRNIQFEVSKRIASKEYYETKLEALKEQFQTLNLDRLTKGYPVLSEYPREMQNEIYTWEAKIDVCQTVINTLEYRLKVGQDAEEEIHKNDCLKNGLLQAVELRGDKIYKIDGQMVSYNEEGKPFIDDPYSLYPGELLDSYRRLSNYWLKLRQIANNEKLRKLQEQAREFGRPIPKTLPIASRKAVSRESLPKMTDEFRGILNPKNV